MKILNKVEDIHILIEIKRNNLIISLFLSTKDEIINARP